MFGILDYLKMGAAFALGLVVYHLYAVSIGYPEARIEARKGYVLQAEKIAAEAKAAELQRQLILSQQIREQADKQAEQLQLEAQMRREADEKAIAEDKGDGPSVTADDLDWIERVRKPR